MSPLRINLLMMCKSNTIPVRLNWLLGACGAPTRYREVVLTVTKHDVLLGQVQNHLTVAGGCAAGSNFTTK